MTITIKCTHSNTSFKINMTKTNFYKLYSLIQCGSNIPKKINNKWYQSDGTYLTLFKNGKTGANYIFLNLNVLNELDKII